jgi:ABC-type transport system involved in Fe-S cluster assembly fused permease/ATPase subunit
MYEYWESLGEANGKASEALNNVRTVKAFSTEWLELASYVKSTRDALNKNLTDALGSAATTLLTTYLDLGGTVLILWYGGDLTIAGEVSVGTLVAFRLYWGSTSNTSLVSRHPLALRERSSSESRPVGLPFETYSRPDVATIPFHSTHAQTHPAVHPVSATYARDADPAFSHTTSHPPVCPPSRVLFDKPFPAAR